MDRRFMLSLISFLNRKFRITHTVIDINDKLSLFDTYTIPAVVCSPTSTGTYIQVHSSPRIIKINFRNDIKQWLDDNCKGWILYNNELFFRSQTDALAFKLRWL